MYKSVAILLFTVATGAASDQELDPRQSVPHPTDVEKSHVETIVTQERRYTVIQGGTMDGRNCRSPMGCGIAREGAFLQTWESNRSVRMENVGQTDVVNPWLSNGRNNFRNVDEIVAAAVTPGMTDAEKAFALWFQEIQYRHHSPGDNNELGDPVKVFNVYGYNTCGNDSICLATLWREAGLQGGAGAGPRTLHLPGVLRRPLAFLRRRHALRLPPARQRDRGRRTGHRARPRPDQAHAFQGNPHARHLVGRAGHVRDVLLRGRGHRGARRHSRHHDEHGPAARRSDRVAVGTTLIR